MINGCFWIVAGVAVLALAISLGLLPLWAIGLLASPVAFLAGHRIGWHKASRQLEAAGYKKVASDGEQLRRAWRFW